MKVALVKDYLNLVQFVPGGLQTPLDAPAGDMVILELSSPGNYAAVRPSGTEPKVKFYTFTFEPAEQIGDLEITKREVGERLMALGRDLAAYAKG
jgi:phosphoglucomutase/phosphomannomutase